MKTPTLFVPPKASATDHSSPVTASPPPVDHFKPDQLRPLIESRFRPLPFGPPCLAEFQRITRRSHMNLVLRQAMSSNHQGATGVELRGYDQNGMNTQKLKGSAYI